MKRNTYLIWLPPLFAAGLVGAMLSMSSPGCGRQGEGERCDLAAGEEGEDSDCADGLVCTAASSLENISSDICCPQSGSFSDIACTPSQGQGGGGGTGGTGGMAGGGGTAGMAGEGGTAGGGTGGTAGTGGTGGGGTGGTAGGGTGGTAGAGGV